MLIGLAVAVCWAFASILEKDLLERLSRECILSIAGFILFFVNFVVFLAQKPKTLPEGDDIVKLVLLGSVGFYLGYTLFFVALKSDLPVVVLSLTNLTGVFVFLFTPYVKLSANRLLGLLLGTASAFLVA